MSAENKAVFLSYASQDAETALRICDALRAAQVEVWFDQNELVGGDAWDAKIRKQIAECALFVPIVSANTEARAEGYFRLEWLLAVERARLMADDHPFLFPVVLGEVNEVTARVPEKFRQVQWTRLRTDGLPTALVARVAGLLLPDTSGGGRPRPVVPEAVRAGRHEKRRGVVPHSWGWRVLPVVAALVGIVWAVKVWSPAAPEPVEGKKDAPPPAEATAPSPPISAARQLLARAWVQLNTQELARAELETADTLCKRAAELDPVDAEVWATWTHVHSWFIHHAFDGGTARREAARDCAAKAIRLDPASFEARLAQAIHRTRGGGGGDRAPTAQLLRDLLRERPDEPRCLQLLGRHLMAKKETHEEGLAALEQLARNPNFTALAWVEIGWTWHNRDHDMRRALEAADKSIAAKPFWHNLGLKAQIAAIWLGDLTLARETAMQMSEVAQKEDWAATLIDGIHYLRRKPGDRVKFLTALPQEWLSSHQFHGPKAALLGEARLMAGATETGKRDLVRAVALIDQRLAEQPNNARLLGLKAACQHGSGDIAAARVTYALFRQLEKRWWEGRVDLFETPEAVLEMLEKTNDPPSWAILELEPSLDPLRQNPRFIALLERTRQDPRLSPHALLVQPGRAP